VAWVAQVLVDRRDPVELPAAPLGAEVPAAAQGWLRSTACVQCDDEALQAQGRRLARDVEDVAGYVQAVLQFTSTHRGEPGAPFTSLDASAALRCGGSCTSRANLAAALLRAQGIPARTSAHLPTWADRLYEHWHVEYWHPGHGWVWIEPTLGKLLPEPCTMVVLNVANPEDEDQAFHPIITHSNVMPGVARFAVHEISLDLTPWRGPRGTANRAAGVLALEADPAEVAALFAAARAAWKPLAAAGRAGVHLQERTNAVRTYLVEDEPTAAELRILLERLAD
jgi:transglutaminase-like putative cysteine protease